MSARSGDENWNRLSKATFIIGGRHKGVIMTVKIQDAVIALLSAAVLLVSASVTLAQSTSDNCTPEHRAAGHCK